MDDLAHRFAPLSLPKDMQKLPRATNFERLKEPIRYGSTNGTGFDVSQSIYGLRTGPFLGGTKPVYEDQFLKSTQAGVERYVEARARALQRQHNRLLQNRVWPFQANGFNNSNKCGLGGGFVRESGGTGVFHPRIVNTNQNGTTFDSKRKQSLRNRHSLQEIQFGRMTSMKRVNVGKQEDCYYHLPPEMELPKDWTY